MLNPFASLIESSVFVVLGQIYNLFAVTAIVWAPILLVWLAQRLWLQYRQMQFIQKNFQFIMLEVKVPRIIDKTPVAMELALHAFLQNRPLNWYERWWKGEVSPWFSLEIDRKSVV